MVMCVYVEIVCEYVTYIYLNYVYSERIGHNWCANVFICVHYMCLRSICVYSLYVPCVCRQVMHMHNILYVYIVKYYMNIFYMCAFEETRLICVCHNNRLFCHYYTLWMSHM